MTLAILRVATLLVGVAIVFNGICNHLRGQPWGLRAAVASAEVESKLQLIQRHTGKLGLAVIGGSTLRTLPVRLEGQAGQPGLNLSTSGGSVTDTVWMHRQLIESGAVPNVVIVGLDIHNAIPDREKSAIDLYRHQSTHQSGLLKSVRWIATLFDIDSLIRNLIWAIQGERNLQPWEYDASGVAEPSPQLATSIASQPAPEESVADQFAKRLWSGMRPGNVPYANRRESLREHVKLAELSGALLIFLVPPWHPDALRGVERAGVRTQAIRDSLVGQATQSCSSQTRVVDLLSPSRQMTMDGFYDSIHFLEFTAGDVLHMALDPLLDSCSAEVPI